MPDETPITNTYRVNRSTDQSLINKEVLLLECCLCGHRVCNRGMRAILLADSKVQLFSADRLPIDAVQLVGNDYSTGKCYCRIRDIACSICGNIVGYHVTMPCKSCLEACNNGHFWIYHAQAVRSFSRLNDEGYDMTWEELVNPDKIPSVNESPHSFIICGR